MRWWRGPDGVRAGWCVLAYLVLLVGLVFAVVFLLPRAWLVTMVTEGRIGPAFMVVNEMAVLVPVVVATAVMTRFEGRPFLSCGLAGGRVFANLLWGTVCGLGLLGGVMLVLAVTGHAVFFWGGLRAGGVVFYALAWAFASLLTGLAEELALRGYLLQTFTRGLGFSPALIITSLMFGAMHISNHGEGFIGVAAAVTGGAIMALGVRGTGSLWWSIGLHGAWDYTENFLAGTPDSGQVTAGALLRTVPHGPAWLSGGATGPEGSLFALAVLAAALALAFSFFAPRFTNK